MAQLDAKSVQDQASAGPKEGFGVGRHSPKAEAALSSSRLGFSFQSSEYKSLGSSSTENGISRNAKQAGAM